MNKLQAALFDLDGVVFDTEPQYSIFWGGECRRYFPNQPGLENRIKGQTLVQIYDSVFAGLPEEQPLITARLNEFERHMTFTYVAGFLPFIDRLRQQGVKTAVVTSSNLEKMQRVYESHPEFSKLFDAILTSEDFAHSKPHPDCYLRGAARLGADVSRCVGFEDSFNGLRSVRAAGMFVVGLATTNPAEAIMPYANMVVTDYNNEQLSALFK
jgi:HAD superfamily hydrolase (TIGR01509 family)